ncbi:isoleucyl-tRNA synthetase [Hyphomonas polymorpha PS728]|uniref:Isoleucine--tRNA ligase n=1 Tax=Hyphomonas polymorpha PS728 TaxID=1280954 RepID=A0A062V9U0_9PROT|nr:isoleucine--tRNA ligase [Hyphomonas polymorpha]KCZ96905.1 isoleucyl-tRNA synthetase [Hyphomonas polymorpha PS728]
MTESTAPERDYRDTLFLPKTEFPMRAGLPKAEPEWIKRWDALGLYEKLRADAKGRDPFILHDGPPYANGHIHLGTALNKIIKDIIVRSHQMQGFDASYLPGWDCHGLPIEWKVEEEFRSKNRPKDSVPPAEFRAACRAYAEHWVGVQKAEFRALGIEGEWDNPYLTMAFESEAMIVSEFLDMAMKGGLVRGAKPIMWSPVERTALAEAEVEYHDRKVPVVWVKFPVVALEGAQHEYSAEDGGWNRSKEEYSILGKASVVIWTTTPWTIPANQAVSYSELIQYRVYRVDAVDTEKDFTPFAKVDEYLIIAENRATEVFEKAFVTKWTEMFPLMKVEHLSLLRLAHPLHALSPFFQHPIPLLAGDHVTDDAGTGFVHTAPAHGEDDFDVWVNSGHTTQEIRQIVDPDGKYTDEVPAPLAGLDIIVTSGKKRGEAGKANNEVIRLLAESGNLLARGITTIRDAHSWRSKAPVIRRATPQWFIAMDKPVHGGKTLRELALKGIADTEFFPPTGRNRLQAMVEGRPDWLISRQRNWGVPITLFVNAKGEPHTAALSKEQADKLNANIKAAIEKTGVDGWFATPDADFFAGTGVSPEGWEKVTDVLDVWFDSGTTHAFALRKRGIIDNATGQADVYMEGSDQHRGWFQSSLLESCATRGMAPYKKVVTHGFIVDADGKKMSKSIGNTIEPQQVQKDYGIEILRIWTASADYMEDLRISDEIIKGTVETYRKLRNTLRYLLGALDGYTAEESVLFSPSKYEPVFESSLTVRAMPGLERFMLHRLAELDAQVRAAYANFDFKRVMTLLINFVNVELSAVYFDIRKDSLYCDPAFATAKAWDSETSAYGDRRRAARTVMAAVFERLLGWLAPVMPFTTDEAFGESHLKGTAPSVHLTLFPPTPEAWKDDALAARWEKIFAVRRVVTGALEVERREKRIGASLEAAPKVIIADKALIDAFEGESAADIFITSGAELVLAAEGPSGAFTLPDAPGIWVVPEKATGIKCRRSWKYFDPATADPAFPDITPRDALAVKAWDKVAG